MAKKVIRVPFDEEKDKLYQQGYIKIPEKPDTGKAQLAMLAEFLSKESW